MIAASVPRAATVELTIGTRQFPIEADRIHVIGRGQRADVRIEDPSVALAHATFCVHSGRLILEDLGSQSGTWIGAVRIRGECEVPLGTTLRIGDVDCSIRAISPVATPLDRREGEGFRELMATELRRAPWFGLSALMHALLFLLLWLFAPVRDLASPRFAAIDVGRDEPTIDVDRTEHDRDSDVEVEDPLDEPLPLPDSEIEPTFETLDSSFEPAPTRSDSLAESLLADGSALFTPTRSGGGDILDVLRAGGQSDGFRSTVAGLRKSGLEIVFVIDSTGSMGPVLDTTRRRMVRMLQALRALVPDARVGIVTYRDHGRREEYLTRQVPLSRDFYRTLSFVHSLRAAGGGDRPEAILEGMQVAIDQPWGPNSRRVIVLIGDAPAHPGSERKLAQTLRSFTQDRRSNVHAIMTAPDVFGGIEQDTSRSFEAIATAGRGLALPFEREDRILEQVLTLAVGQEFRDAVSAIFELLDAERGSIASSPSPSEARIRRELARPVLDDRFVERLAAMPDRETAAVLIATLRSTQAPVGSRQAASWALQNILRLSEPPLAPESDGPIDEAYAARLRTEALRLPERADLVEPDDPELDSELERRSRRDTRRGPGSGDSVRERRHRVRRD